MSKKPHPVSFVHLQLHTEFSLTDGIIRVERGDDDGARFRTLVEQAADLGFPAIAVTDLGNLFAAVKFYKSAEAKGAGVKPILGADLMVEPRVAGEPPERLTALVMNPAGYRNLV